MALSCLRCLLSVVRSWSLLVVRCLLCVVCWCRVVGVVALSWFVLRYSSFVACCCVSLVVGYRVARVVGCCFCVLVVCCVWFVVIGCCLLLLSLRVACRCCVLCFVCCCRCCCWLLLRV